MSYRGVSAPELVERLRARGLHDIDPERVNNWRKGVAPRLSELPLIVEVLAMNRAGGSEPEPTYLAERMGIIASQASFDDVVRMAYRLQLLQKKYLRAQADAARYGTAAGAAAIVQAAMSTQRWAVAAWPAIEGPSDCRLHVADRVDIRRNTGELEAPLDHKDVWEDERMREALRAAYAYPAGRRPRWAANSPGVTNWSIAHIGTPMAATTSQQHPGFTSAAFFSLTIDSWVNDVASLTATVLGYGLETTRDLAIEVYGLEQGRTAASERNPMHRWLLSQAPDSLAWGHYAHVVDDPSALFGGSEQDPRILHIWLKEDPQVLEEWVSFAPRDPAVSLEDLIRTQEGIQEAIAALKDPSRVLVLPVRHCGKANTEARWTQVLETVLQLTETMAERGYLSTALLGPAQGRFLSQRPNIAVPLYDWLVARGSHAVKARPGP